MHLEISSLLSVPLDIYDKNFTFLVNSEEFKTSKLISDLLSPKICQLHSSDPTIDIFNINTQHRGNFTHILDLVDFKDQNISDNELPFIIEVILILDNDSIKLQDFTNYQPITTENVFSEIGKHEKFNKFYSKRLFEETDFISSHFFEICKVKFDEFLKLHVDTIKCVLTKVMTRSNFLNSWH